MDTCQINRNAKFLESPSFGAAVMCQREQGMKVMWILLWALLLTPVSSRVGNTVGMCLARYKEERAHVPQNLGSRYQHGLEEHDKTWILRGH